MTRSKKAPVVSSDRGPTKKKQNVPPIARRRIEQQAPASTVVAAHMCAASRDEWKVMLRDGRTMRLPGRALSDRREFYAATGILLGPVTLRREVEEATKMVRRRR